MALHALRRGQRVRVAGIDFVILQRLPWNGGSCKTPLRGNIAYLPRLIFSTVSRKMSCHSIKMPLRAMRSQMDLAPNSLAICPHIQPN